MVEYQPKGISFPVYYYYPASEIDFRDKYDPDNKANEIILKLLAIIKTKKCNVCDRQASILFISKDISPFNKYKTEPREEFAQKGEYLCKEHALIKVIPAIKNSIKHFDTYEGLCLPHTEDGYQATVAF